MSNGHYTALVDAHHVMYRALVDILVNQRSLESIRERARLAIYEAERISKQAGYPTLNVTQPKPEEATK